YEINDYGDEIREPSALIELYYIRAEEHEVDYEHERGEKKRRRVIPLPYGDRVYVHEKRRYDHEGRYGHAVCPDQVPGGAEDEYEEYRAGEHHPIDEGDIYLAHVLGRGVDDVNPR